MGGGAGVTLNKLESGKNAEIRDKERKRATKRDLSLEVSRMKNWLLDGTSRWDTSASP